MPDKVVVEKGILEKILNMGTPFQITLLTPANDSTNPSIFSLDIPGVPGFPTQGGDYDVNGDGVAEVTPFKDMTLFITAIRVQDIGAAAQLFDYFAVDGRVLFSSGALGAPWNAPGILSKIDLMGLPVPVPPGTAVPAAKMSDVMGPCVRCVNNFSIKAAQTGAGGQSKVVLIGYAMPRNY